VAFVLLLALLGEFVFPELEHATAAESVASSSRILILRTAFPLFYA
jgi:hypothetical protein